MNGKVRVIFVGLESFPLPVAWRLGGSRIPFASTWQLQPALGVSWNG